MKSDRVRRASPLARTPAGSVATSGGVVVPAWASGLSRFEVVWEPVPSAGGAENEPLEAEAGLAAAVTGAAEASSPRPGR